MGGDRFGDPDDPLRHAAADVSQEGSAGQAPGVRKPRPAEVGRAADAERARGDVGYGPANHGTNRHAGSKAGGADSRGGRENRRDAGWKQPAGTFSGPAARGIAGYRSAPRTGVRPGRPGTY